MTKIWRIETREGDGPWRPSGFDSSFDGMTTMIKLAKQEHVKYLVARGAELDDALDYADDHLEFSRDRPPPTEDGLPSLYDLQDDMVCGFASLRQYKRWFSSRTIRRIMTNSGYMLNCYEVDKHSTGGQQVIFLKDSATLVETRAPTNC